MESTEQTAAGRRSFRSWLEPHRVFLALAIPFGLAVLAANAPYQAPDENDHFFRAFQVSEGTWASAKQDGNSGGSLPLLLHRSTDMGDIPFRAENKMTAARFREKWERARVDWDKEHRVFVAFPHTAVYPAWAYLPQSLAIGAGRVLDVGPLGLMYLGRLAAFAAAIGLGFAALRVLPVFRWSALVLMLMPMSLYLTGSIAPDGVLIGCSFLLAGFLARFGASSVGPPGKWTTAALLGCAAMLGSVKAVYLPLALLVPIFVLPRLAGWRARAGFGAAFVVVTLVPLLVWGRTAAEIYTVGRTDVRIDPAQQWHYVMGDPAGFVRLAADSLWEQRQGIYRWFVGTLGWGDTVMPEWFYGSFGWALAAMLAVESTGGGGVSWTQRAWIVAAAAASVAMMCGAIYAAWNGVGSRGSIEGLAGRYFIPIAAFLIAGFPAFGSRRIPAIVAPVMGTVVATVCAATCLFAVLRRYYHLP